MNLFNFIYFLSVWQGVLVMSAILTSFFVLFKNLSPKENIEGKY